MKDLLHGWYGAVQALTLLDEHYELDGDEDGGVGIVCKPCDSGGQPVAYLGWDNPYSRVPEVTHVRTITELMAAALDHWAEHHQGIADGPPSLLGAT